jgi:hypothetical protein
MKRLLSYTLILVVSGLCSGCSLLIGNGGKDLSKVFGPRQTEKSIRSELGKPVAQVTYPQPRAVSEVPELSDQVSFRKNLASDALVASYADYRFQGRLKSHGDSGAGMAIEMFYLPTLGLAELVLFPMAVQDAAKQSRDVWLFRVWYSPEHTYVAHRSGFGETNSHWRGE